MKPIQDGQSGKEFSEEELHEALLNVEDLMESTATPYLLLDVTAHAIYNEMPLNGKKIIIGVLKKYITRDVILTIKSCLPNIDIQDNGFHYMVGKIPIYVKFIRNRYKFFQNPDFRFYMAGEYYIPNPFDDYWGARFLIR